MGFGRGGGFDYRIEIGSGSPFSLRFLASDWLLKSIAPENFFWSNLAIFFQYSFDLLSSSRIQGVHSSSLAFLDAFCE
jgi:hypothetical protein